MNPSRQIQGRRNKAFGDIFERRIEHALTRYEGLNVACIQKTPEAMKVLRPLGNGHFECVFEKKCQPDFKGSLCDGTAIVFEAKHTDTDRIRQEVVTETQTKFFRTYSRHGARCYVMVSMGLASFYRVPWDVWEHMKELFGHKYMDAKDLKPYRVSESEGIIRILDGIELKGDYDEDTKD